MVVLKTISNRPKILITTSNCMEAKKLKESDIGVEQFFYLSDMPFIGNK